MSKSGLMIKRPLYDPDERIFTIADVKKLFIRSKKKVIRAFYVGALVACGFFLIKIPPSYAIRATFKESMEKESYEMGNFQKILGGFSGNGPESQTIAFMQSFQVLKPLIERMGVQVEVIKKKGLISTLYRRIRDNLLAEMWQPLSDIDGFTFRDVIYEGDKKIQYTLQFKDAEHFSIAQKKVAAWGRVGVPVFLPDAQLTVLKVPKTLRIGSPYSLSIRPWFSAVQAIRSKFQVNSMKTHKSVFELNFSHRDRYFGTELLNALMEEYRNYLKRDHDQIAKDQLAYLEEKQEDICGKISKVFDEYTGYLQSNFSQSGQLGLKQELDWATREHRTASNKVLALDLEWERLSRMESDQKTFAFLAESPLSQTIHGIVEAIANLKQQRDLINISFAPKRNFFDQKEYENKREELKLIRERLETMNHLLQGKERERSLFDPESSLETWAIRLEEAQRGEKEDLVEYIEKDIRLLAMQEKIVQEQMIYNNNTPSEFQGIDLTIARELFVEYNKKLDKNSTMMSHLSGLKEEIENSDFEISSLSAVLPDSLSQRLIGQANDIALKLKDEKHRSEKEEGRWTEELVLQKKILKNHLDQLYKVELLKFNSIQDKIESLQALSLRCISGQISALQERLSDCIKNRKSAIAAEKEILEAKMGQMLKQFTDLPEKWRKEKWLNLRSQMGIKMVHALTDLVESKTIASHLHHIESKPLDLAIVPPLPAYPGLLLKVFLGAFLAGFGRFFFAFLQCAFAGFPTSIEKLRAIRYPLAGEISPFCDGPVSEPIRGEDLELLRRISLLIAPLREGSSLHGSVIGVIEGKGPDYSYALGEHLARMSLHPLLLRCDFNVQFNPSDLPGLLQVWKRETEEIPIRKYRDYDYLSSGGYTPYGAEIVRSDLFQKLLEQLKRDYDCILLIFRAPLNSVESISPLSFCDRALVTVSGEPTEQLTPFLDWAYHEEMCRLTFLVASSSMQRGV